MASRCVLREFCLHCCDLALKRLDVVTKFVHIFKESEVAFLRLDEVRHQFVNIRDSSGRLYFSEVLLIGLDSLR